jgi:hypothetical protein
MSALPSGSRYNVAALVLGWGAALEMHRVPLSQSAELVFRTVTITILKCDSFAMLIPSLHPEPSLSSLPACR